jgi:hypothetical protein
MIKYNLVASTEMVVAELPLFAVAKNTSWKAQRLPMAKNVYNIELSTIHIVDQKEADVILGKWDVLAIIGSGQNITTNEEFILIQCPDASKKAHDLVKWVPRELLSHLLEDANEHEAFGSCDITVRYDIGVKDLRAFLWEHPYFTNQLRSSEDQIDTQHEWDCYVMSRKSRKMKMTHAAPSFAKTTKSPSQRSQVIKKIRFFI